MPHPAGVETLTDSGAPLANAMPCSAHEKLSDDHFPNRVNLYYWMPTKSCGASIIGGEFSSMRDPGAHSLFGCF